LVVQRHELGDGVPDVWSGRIHSDFFVGRVDYMANEKNSIGVVSQFGGDVLDHRQRILDDL
jgi:hypothetical protein